MRNILFILFLLVLTTGTVFSAVNAPELRCVSVDASGNVTLTWIPPVDPGNEFLNYNVFVSPTQNGVYTFTTVNTLGTSTFFDNTNNANLDSYFYYVVTVYDDGSGPTSSAPSDTGQSMLPTFGTVTDSTAVIEWDPVFDPNIATNSGQYTLYRKMGVTGSFVSLGTLFYGNETFTDAFKVCSETISYYVETMDALGCVSQSAVLEAEFKDLTGPATPVLDSVTVNSAGQPQMGWRRSSSLDTRGYVVLYWTKATLMHATIDTVFGTSFTETLGLTDPNLEWEGFTVYAYDSCFDANISTGPDDQQTIHLSLIPNNCDNSVSLNWTRYYGWDDLENYELLVSVNGNPYQVAFTFPNTDTSFIHQKTDDLALYCYRIRATNTSRSKSSSSNRKCAVSSAAVTPTPQYFKEITVLDNQDIHVESLTDTSLGVSQYVLYRSLDRFQNFYEVDQVPFENNPIIELNDYSASVDQTSYFYRIGLEDTCGSLLYFSPAAASVYLQGYMDEDSLLVSLSWNEYLGWDSVLSSVEEYVINLLVDGTKKEVGTVPKGTTTFSYPLKDEITLGANFCFEIEARESEGNKFDQRDTVLSNQVCFTDNLKVFVPNAFRPSGANPIFYPVFSFGDVSQFKMIIYDRWGGQIFETTDIDEGWNGQVNGSNAQFGSYVYHLEIANFTGARYKKSGTFVLLR